MNNVRIDFNSKAYMITPPFNMNISMERINYSDLLQDQYLSNGIDFEDFDKSDHLNIRSTSFELNFKKDILTYLLRCLDLNINFTDFLDPGYQLFSWNIHDFMMYLDLE